LRATAGKELVSGRDLKFADGKTTFDLESESVAVIELAP
jgi:hypothetical protein